MCRVERAFRAVAITASFALVFACAGEKRSSSHADSPIDARPDRFALKTVTICRAGALTGVDSAETIVELTPTSVTVGFDDEVLAGVRLPVSFDGKSFELRDVVIPTAEEFGAVRIRRGFGAVANGSLQLENEIDVLDVSCTTTGYGPRIE